MAKDFVVSATFKAIDKMSKTFKKIGATGNKIVNGLTKKFKALGDSIKKFSSSNIGKSLSFAGAIGGISALVGGLKSAVMQGMEFEQVMVNASAKWGIKKGTKEFKELEKAARDVGAKTQFSAMQAAQGLDYLAMAGLTAQQSISALPGVVNLAIATNTDLAKATDIATDSLGAFGLMSKDPLVLANNLSHMNDVMAKTTITANTDLVTMFESIKEAGPVAKSAGASLEETAAMIGILANSGIKGGKSGTVLKNMFVNLQKPTKQMSDVLKAAGVRVADSTGKMLPMSNIIGQLHKGMKKYTSVQRAAALATLFGKEALAGATVLFDSGKDAIEKYAKQLENSDGSTKQLAETMANTTQGRINGMNSAIGNLSISFFKISEGPLNDLISGFTVFVRWVDNAIQKNPALAMTIQYLVIGIGALVGVITAVTLATTLFNAALALNPIGLIVVAVAGLVAGLVYLYEKFEIVQLVIKSVWDILSSLVNWGMNSLIGFFKSVYDHSLMVQNAVNGLISFFDRFKQSISNVGASILSSIIKPLLWVLKLAAKIPGVGDEVKKLASRLEDFQIGLNTDTTNVEQAQETKVPLVSQQITNATTNTTTNHKATLTIKDDNNRAELKHETPNNSDGNIAIARSM